MFKGYSFMVHAKNSSIVTNIAVFVLTAMKSGFSSMTLSRSGRADLDFPIAK